MEDLIKLIQNHGVSLVIVALFLWDWIINKKKINDTLEQNAKCLESIEQTNINTSSSLELLKQSMETQKEFLFRHDERCQKIENKINILLERM